MRLQHAKHVAEALPADAPGQQQAEAERLRWRAWHGKARDARLTLKRLRTLLPAPEREPVRKLKRALQATDWYLRSQSAWLADSDTCTTVESNCVMNGPTTATAAAGQTCGSMRSSAGSRPAPVAAVAGPSLMPRPGGRRRPSSAPLVQKGDDLPGRPGLAQAREDAQDAVVVGFGARIRHGIRGKRDVEPQLARMAGR